MSIPAIARICYFTIWGGAVALTLLVATDTPNRWGALFFVSVFVLFAAALSLLVKLVSGLLLAAARRKSLNN